MKLITKDTDYAIRALSYIAKRKKEIVTTTDLVNTLKIPRPFLRKILQRLNKEGLLKSYKGIGGGFVLVRSPRGIRVIELIKIFQGPVKFNEHLLRKNICPHTKRCILKKKLDAIERHLITELNKITIHDLT